MNRNQFFPSSIFLSLAVFCITTLSFAQSDRTDTYKSDYIKSSDGSQMFYRVGFHERKVLSPNADDNVEIVLDVFYYPAKGSTETGARYHLQRIGAPVMQGNYWIIKWKLASREKEDVMKGKFPKTLVTRLQPQYYLFLDMSKTEFISMKYSDPNADDEE